MSAQPEPTPPARSRWMQAWARTRAAAIAVFVSTFLAAVLVQNLDHFLPLPVPFRAPAERLLRALGADQYWIMFGAYFPPFVRVPVVQVVLAGGRRVFLEPSVTPEFSEALAQSFRPGRLSATERTTRWRTNFGTGRIEKFESRVGNPRPPSIGVRTAYTAVRVRDWMSRNPELADRIRFVDLLSVKVAGAREGVPPHVLSVEPVSIEPRLLDSWPVPQARQLTSPRR